MITTSSTSMKRQREVRNFRRKLFGTRNFHGIAFLLLTMCAFAWFNLDRNSQVSYETEKTPSTVILPHANSGDQISLPRFASQQYTNPECQLYQTKAIEHIRSAHERHQISSNKGSVTKEEERIFIMVSTDFPGSFDARQFCSLESAAKHNPRHQIEFHVNNVSEVRGMFEELFADFSHVSLVEINHFEVFKGTPLDRLHDIPEFWEKNYFKDYNLKTAYRLGKLWNQGGIYLDTHVVSVNALDGIGRAIALESGDSSIVGDQFFSFNKHDEIVWKAMVKFMTAFNEASKSTTRMLNFAPSRTIDWLLSRHCNTANAPEWCYFSTPSDASFFYFKNVTSAQTMPWTEHCHELNDMLSS
ncbi:hypothetical protein BC830DRAFT_758770 [Chytriomyces sp. MP71]|nr:hypothetical protein BC830DRAFT_758770 [Chytriomyces sp. MP71]